MTLAEARDFFIRKKAAFDPDCTKGSSKEFREIANGF
jgi:hypothetical protein